MAMTNNVWHLQINFTQIDMHFELLLHNYYWYMNSIITAQHSLKSNSPDHLNKASRKFNSIWYPNHSQLSLPPYERIFFGTNSIWRGRWWCPRCHSDYHAGRYFRCVTACLGGIRSKSCIQQEIYAAKDIAYVACKRNCSIFPCAKLNFLVYKCFKECDSFSWRSVDD